MTPTDITKRLLTYRLSLLHFKEMGLNEVYSHSLSMDTGYSATLIRKDFSHLKIRGKRRSGYEIDTILESIGRYFGEKEIHQVILVGLGNIGKAMIQYKDFEKQKIKIIAVFDVDPAKQRKKMNVPVLPVEDCPKFIADHDIVAAVIAVPALSAQNICDRLVYAGIKGILNFAPVNLKVPDNVYVANVSLSDELEQVIYHASQRKQTV